jgi:hypothetical protein
MLCNTDSIYTAESGNSGVFLCTNCKNVMKNILSHVITFVNYFKNMKMYYIK